MLHMLHRSYGSVHVASSCCGQECYLQNINISHFDVDYLLDFDQIKGLR